MTGHSRGNRGRVPARLAYGVASWLTVGAAACAAAQDPSADDAAAFRALCAQQAAAAEQAQRTVVEGRDGWLFLPAELRHLGVGRFWGPEAAKVSRTTDPAGADPAPAIVDFHQQLAARGIDLVVVPVPAKAVVYPQGLGSRLTGRADTFHQQFYEDLRRQGIEVLDLADDFLAARGAGPDLYCRHDTHWSGQGCVLAARRIAARIEPAPWRQGLARKAYTGQVRDTQITGDLWQALGRPAAPKEVLPLRFVQDAAGSPPVDDRASPILLLGDSHNLIFHAGADMQATGAGLADQLALELQTSIDVLGVRGSGATPARVSLYRRAKADPAYLTAKRLVVWCFSAREFTEGSGWKKVPVGP